MTQHIDTVHRGLKPYSCKMCNYAAGRKDTLKRHIDLMHQGSKIHICYICGDYKTKNPLRIKKHLRNVHNVTHSEKSLIFNNSSSIMLDKNEAQNNSKNEILFKLKDNQMEQMNITSSNSAELEDIIMKKKGFIEIEAQGIQKNEKYFKCDVCSYNARDKKKVQIHIDTVHRGLKPYLCSACSYRAGRKDTLKRHFYLVHKDLKDFNYKILSMPEQIGIHKPEVKLDNAIEFFNFLDEVEEKNTKVNIFGPSSHNYKIVLENSLQKSTPIRDFSFEEKMSKVYPAKNYEIANDYTPLYLEKCSQKEIIKQHHTSQEQANDETINKKHKCKVCSYSASEKNTLKRHTDSVHHGVKPFECDMCCYSASDRASVRIHKETVHKGLKPFKCDMCTYSAGRKDTLKRHVSKLHKKLTY